MRDSESMRNSGPLVTLIKYFLAMYTLVIIEINFRAFQELLTWFPILLCETKLLCEETHSSCVVISSCQHIFNFSTIVLEQDILHVEIGAAEMVAQYLKVPAAELYDLSSALEPAWKELL